MSSTVQKRRPFFNPRNFKNSYLFLLLLIWAIVVLFPPFWALLTSIKPTNELFTLDMHWLPQNPTLENYRIVFTDPVLLRYLINTLFVSLVSTAIVIVLATLAGYGFSRYRLKGGKVGLTILIACQMFPPIMFIVPYFLLMKNIQVYNTYLALIVTRVVFYLPFSTLMIKSFFDSIPHDLEEAATVDGCSQFGIFIRIIVPLVMTGVATIFIFSFLNSWNEFLFSVTVVSRETLRTITVGLAQTKGQYGINWGALMSLSLVSLVPPLIIFMLMQQYFIKGLTAGAVKT
jgi:ABC-type glycerol-3-phosphate transport system permease component